MQFDADGLPVDGPGRATPRSGGHGGNAGGSSRGSGTSMVSDTAAPGAGGDLEAENRLLRSRLQAVESVSRVHTLSSVALLQRCSAPMYAV